MSALGLQRVLGLGSYETAWSLLHKLRRAMVRPGRDKLVGEIEVDETALGPSKPGRLGRGTFADKAIVAIAVEARARGACGRVRLARIRDCSGPVVTEFVCTAVAPGDAMPLNPGFDEFERRSVFGDLLRPFERARPDLPDDGDALRGHDSPFAPC